LWDEYRKLHKLLVQLLRRDELCRRWREIPGVGPLVAMTLLAAVEDRIASPGRRRSARFLA